MLKLHWKKYLAETVGTGMLTLFACGIATTGDYVATAFAFGFVILFAAFILGPISGCHINPAVSLAMLIRKKISLKEFGLYVASQFVGAFVGSLILLALFAAFPQIHSLGQNFINVATLGALNLETGEFYLNAWSYIAAFLIEAVLTCAFVIVILWSTDDKNGKSKFAPLFIAGALLLVHLMGIPFTGTSVNPARSFAPAVLTAFFGDVTSISQVWIWLLAPMAGGALAAVLYGVFNKEKKVYAAPVAPKAEEVKAEEKVEEPKEENTDAE